ncbi:hypothetical protein TIFTF001_010819 [Ficus carica]|uniref:Uncharacterized protein n=1 Tax=Ficus carica TaxID=3494 RepID=A0AA88D2C5_FICCA|nr:hypothetical protein TIFTF001_010819 [Ficus carica]
MVGFRDMVVYGVSPFLVVGSLSTAHTYEMDIAHKIIYCNEENGVFMRYEIGLFRKKEAVISPNEQTSTKKPQGASVPSSPKPT